jgi:hypothetical protein
MKSMFEDIETRALIFGVIAAVVCPLLYKLEEVMERKRKAKRNLGV